jgi:quinol monooxygenase YgiN
MKTSEQTLQQIERTLRKTIEKFPAAEEATVMTDIHLRVTQETGELTVFNDDDVEITRSVIEQWIDNKDDDFYHEITPVMRKCVEKHKRDIEQMSIMKPFSFVLEQDDKEAVAELYLVDDDTVIIDPDLMEGLDEDLDKFLENLLKD